MKGTRPIDNTEIRQVADAFDGIYEVRNRALFVLGVSTGGRVSELLSLKVDDVYQNGAPVTDLLFDRSVVKGGEVSRAIPLNADGRDAIKQLIGWHVECFGNVNADRFLFPSRQSTGAIDRRTAHEALKKAFNAAGLNGKLATHSMRKAFARRLSDQTADIFAVQEMLGHKSVATTQRYLGVNYATVWEAVKKWRSRHAPATSTHFQHRR